MPSYELAVILRKMTRPETATVLKRIATQIYDNNGLLFGIENLGQRKLPYRIRNHGMWNTEGSYFVMKFDSPTSSVSELQDEYTRDVDIVRMGFTRLQDLREFECTLEEELQPPAYRKDVQELLQKGKKKEMKKWEFKTGLSYNPFTT